MLEEKVLAIIEEICEDDVIYEERDINLKEEGLMDSLAFVELLVRMEEFGIEVAPTEVTYEEIDTPNKIGRRIGIVIGRKWHTFWCN